MYTESLTFFSQFLLLDNVKNIICILNIRICNYLGLVLLLGRWCKNKIPLANGYPSDVVISLSPAAQRNVDENYINYGLFVLKSLYYSFFFYLTLKYCIYK